MGLLDDRREFNRVGTDLSRARSINFQSIQGIESPWIRVEPFKTATLSPPGFACCMVSDFCRPGIPGDAQSAFRPEWSGGRSELYGYQCQPTDPLHQGWCGGSPRSDGGCEHLPFIHSPDLGGSGDLPVDAHRGLALPDDYSAFFSCTQ